MVQMNVSLPESLKSWCENQVEEGRFSTTSDYVRDLIRKDQDCKQAKDKLQNLITEGMESGISEHTIEEIFAIAKEKAKALSNAG